MKKQTGLPVILLAALIFGAVLASAEVALDEVVQAGRFVFYRDHADPHKYYYVPDAPRLATKRDGTPEFTFIKYAKTDGETRGGVIHFLVTWGYTAGELSSAEGALKSADPQARIAGPVPFKQGTFQVVSATAGEGGLFSRRIVGEGKAPIMPGQKAAVSIALTEEGASLLWESFKNPTSDVSVLFALKFTGITPAFQAKLKVNWDKVYTHHDVRLSAEGTVKVVKLKADMQAILDDLRQKGVIQLDVVGENENMQKMLDTVYTHILDMMCEKVPMGPASAAPAAPARVPAAAADLPAVHPARSMDALAEVVRSAGERLRGGPFLDQEQAQSAGTAACSEADRQRANSLSRRGTALLAEKKYDEAVDYYKKAYAACPDPLYNYQVALVYDLYLLRFKPAREYYKLFLDQAGPAGTYAEQRDVAQKRTAVTEQALAHYDKGVELYNQEKYAEAVLEFEACYQLNRHPAGPFYVGHCLYYMGERSAKNRRENYEKALAAYRTVLDLTRTLPDSVMTPEELAQTSQWISELEAKIAALPPAPEAGTEAAKPAGEQAATAGQAQQQTTAGQTTKPPATAGAGTKPPAGQDPTIAQIEQQLLSGQAGKPPGPAGGTKPTPAAQTPAAKPPAQAPAVQPIVSVSLGYTFKRVKMSGNYEVDMRKRLREDRDIVMSGNIGGVFQKYGEDRRFFTVVSLDDPTFQERSVEVILDGQDAEDFKNYINTVSVLFRKQRFSGAPMTGEVKFFADQFAQSGNRLSFKYGRLNEASTEWLDYEYKPKWSFYGGVEWEGDWTKTSDSVLTLSPPVRRRTLEISADEDNILNNGIKALALQIRHRIFGRDILKEIVIDYDKGDPLQARYTYMHEDGDPGYSYKVVWLATDGREVSTEWTSKESPFIYAVFTKK